jgi:hypothetical protein
MSRSTEPNFQVADADGFGPILSFTSFSGELARRRAGKLNQQHIHNREPNRAPMNQLGSLKSFSDSHRSQEAKKFLSSQVTEKNTGIMFIV